MGIMDTLFGPKKSSFDPTAAINAQDASNEKAFGENKTAAGRTGPFGSSVYGPNGVTTTFSGDANDPNSAAGINTGLLKNAGTYIGAGGNMPNYGGISYAQDIADQQYAAAKAYWDPQEAQQRAALEQTFANRGIPIGGGAGTVYGDATGNMYDAQNRAHVAAAAAAAASVPGLQGQLIANQNTMAEEPGRLAGTQLSELGQFAGLLPQAANVSTSPVQSAQIMQQGAEMNDKAAAGRREAIAQAAKLGISLAAAPFTGGASLGGAGLFNGIASQPQPGTYMSQYRTPAGYPTSGVQMPGGAGPLYS